MCKKVVIATLAVLVGLAVVKGTKIGSYLRMAKKDAAAWVDQQVKYETEIKRLRNDIDQLEREDAVYYDRVASQRVDLRKKEEALKKDSGKLETLRNRLTALRTVLNDAGETQQVSYNGNEYSKADIEKQIDIDFNGYKQVKASVASNGAFLVSLKKALALNEEKMSQLKQNRQAMLTELQDLENELVELRQTQAVNATVVDDSAYGRVKSDIAALKNRLAVDKEKLNVRGISDRGPVEQTEQEQTRKAQRQKELDREFPVNPVVNK
jgi:chromosome segregation ATPase